MSPTLASIAFGVLILGLLWLVRDNKSHSSPALWLPVIWLFLSGSRSVSEWLQFSAPDVSLEALAEGDPINRFAYAGLVALGLIVLAARAKKVLELLKANAAIVAFLLYCVVSLGWAEHPDVGIKRWIKLAGDFIMVLIVVSEHDPEAATRRLLVRTGFFLLPLSVLTIKHYPDVGRYYDRWEWATYYSGVTTNKNALGSICLIFGLTAIWQILSAARGGTGGSRVGRVMAHGVILLMALWLFRLANSTTALACFLAGSVVLIYLTIFPSRPAKSAQQFIAGNRVLLEILVLMLLAVPCAVLIGGMGHGLLRAIGKDPTLTDRTLIWELVVSLSPDAWLGTGFENFWLGPRLDKIWSVYSWQPNQAHSGFVEIFLNLGWVGIALVAVILTIGYRGVIAGVCRLPETGDLKLSLFVAAIIYNFTEAALFRISAPIWFVLLLTITVVPALQRVAKKAPAVSRKVQSAMRKEPTLRPANELHSHPTLTLADHRARSS